MKNKSKRQKHYLTHKSYKSASEKAKNIDIDSFFSVTRREAP